MITPSIIAMALGAAAAQDLPAGQWSVTSTIVDLVVPGVPGFMQRMAKGRSTAERKRLVGGQGVEALLAPDPKAGCHVDSQTIAGGRYAQALTCPSKKGSPMRVIRGGDLRCQRLCRPGLGIRHDTQGSDVDHAEPACCP